MPYSHREDFAKPEGARPHFHQPFTMEQWEASNYAPASRIEWFRDARYGMFIHFGLSTFKNKDLSWEVCYTRKPPDTGQGPYPDEEWQSWAGQFTLEKFAARMQDGSAVTFEADDRHLRITLPREIRDAIDTIVELTL